MFGAVNTLVNHAVQNAAVIAILGHVVQNWTEFDAYCLARGGFDPLEVPSRRLCAAAWAFIVEGMDEETRDKLIHQLFDESYVEAKQRTTPTPDGRGTVAMSPKEKWRAPPGWTPPNWNPEKSYRTAQGFMAFQANPK